MTDYQQKVKAIQNKIQLCEKELKNIDKLLKNPKMMGKYGDIKVQFCRSQKIFCQNYNSLVDILYEKMAPKLMVDGLYCYGDQNEFAQMQLTDEELRKPDIKIVRDSLMQMKNQKYSQLFEKYQKTYMVEQNEYQQEEENEEEEKNQQQDFYDNFIEFQVPENTNKNKPPEIIQPKQKKKDLDKLKILNQISYSPVDNNLKEKQVDQLLEAQQNLGEMQNQIFQAVHNQGQGLDQIKADHEQALYDSAQAGKHIKSLHKAHAVSTKRKAALGGGILGAIGGTFASFGLGTAIFGVGGAAAGYKIGQKGEKMQKSRLKDCEFDETVKDEEEKQVEEFVVIGEDQEEEKFESIRDIL